ncbi:GreA/GreB family elongation factor, partial [candidate division WOR-3 bacterium]|nr:GreA/GreB family elongation factor [candidate division WOR-3 bacterium]
AFGLDIKSSVSGDLGVNDNWWNTARDKIKNCMYIDYASGGKGGKFSLRKKPKSPVGVFEPSLENKDDFEKQYEKLLDFLQSAKKRSIDEDLEEKALKTFKQAELRFKEAPPVLRLKFHFLSLDFKKRFKRISLEKFDFSSLTDDEILELVEGSTRTDMKVKLVKTLVASSRIDANLRRRLLTAKSLGFRDVLSQEYLYDDVVYILGHPTESPEALVWAIEVFKKQANNFKQNHITDSAIAEWIFLIAEEHSAEKEERSRKLTSKLREVLKKDDYLIVKNAVLESPLQQAKLVLNWINDLSLFNAVQKSEIRTKLIRLRPEIVVSENLLEEHSDSVYVTKRSYIDRQSLRDKLLHETLPSIVEEIRRAAAMGDLSENFEYHAARSKHREVAAKIAELEDQLSKTRVIDENFVERGKVSIGCEVFLSSKNEKRKYSILGPWDSDPEKGIISYLSPIGAKMLGLKVGDTLEVEGIQWKIEEIQIFDGLADSRTDQRRKLLEEDEFRNVIEKGKTDDEDRRNYQDRRKK